jgi:predicted nucleic acid-binding protein
VVLVDTSIWIRFLAAKEPYASELDRLLAHDAALAHDFVYGELLMGERGGRAKLLSAYGEMHRAASIPHAEVVQFVRHRRLAGRGIGWIDAHLLASALVANAPLFTADTALAAIADELDIGYERNAEG